MIANREAEMGVLGGVLLNNSFDRDSISAAYFTDNRNKVIWKAIQEIKGASIDLSSICAYLQDHDQIKEAGGLGYIASLTDKGVTNIGYYANLIKDCWVKRELCSILEKKQEEISAPGSDIRQIVDSLDGKLSVLGNGLNQKEFKDCGHFVEAVMKEYCDILNGVKDSGILTGFERLDKATGGFKASDMVVIGARPSVGKTAFALSMVHNIAFKHGVKVGFFSLEMDGMTLMQRMLARESRLSSYKIRNAKLEEKEVEVLQGACSRLEEKMGNLLIEDTPNQDLLEIKAQARRMVRDFGVKIVFIDYIGLISTSNTDKIPRFQQVAEISKQIKALARELQIPIVVLSQVNREAGKDRAPILSDLRESGAIEQDADLVMLLDDESKRCDVKVEEDDGYPVKPIKVVIAKQRNGETTGFNLKFEKELVSFTDLDRGELC